MPSPQQFVLRTLTLLAFAIAVSGAAVAQAPSASPTPPAPVSLLAWAYPWDPDFKVPPADEVPHRLPGSTAAVSWVQARDLFFAPDWHPRIIRRCPRSSRADESPTCAPAAPVTAPKGLAVRKARARRSPGGLFQAADGRLQKRRQEVFRPATQLGPVDEYGRQGHDRRRGAAAADYFAALKPKRNTKVVESDTVPKTYIARLFFVKQPEGTEALGRRIVEMPDDVEQFELRDTRSQFTAYVPVGSLAKGEALVRTGNGGKTVPCAICHGADLTGLGPIPSIAGRSPSYIVRQLYDIQHGQRTGPWSPLMVNVVAKLSEDDLISIAAYLAAQEP